MKSILAIGAFLLLLSCNSATQNWLTGLVDFKDLQAKSFYLEISKIKPAPADTTSLNYKIRIYPSKEWVEGQTSEGKTRLNYGMDSCFSLQTGKLNVKPSYFQPVNNGIVNCFEYMVSFEISNSIRYKRVQLVYHDKVIDGKQYILELNK